MGDIPPRTRVTVEFSARTAAPASRVISAKRAHSGSSKGSQWDLLFGSFQILTASIIGAAPWSCHGR